MHTAIDIGNTRIKWARFDKTELIGSGTIDHSEFDKLDLLLSNYSGDDFSLSSVVELPKVVTDICTTHHVKLIDHETPMPLKNTYLTPNTLGMDRLCSAIGGKSIFPENPVLVIDIGTCMKFEYVSEKRIYEGGNISPGLQMRFSALHHYTSKLPSLDPKHTTGPIGRSTEEALRLGVQQGMLFEIRTMIDTMNALHPSIKTVATGGDLSFFANDLKTHIFADPLLVLRGVNEIYLHNS